MSSTVPTKEIYGRAGEPVDQPADLGRPFDVRAQPEPGDGVTSPAQVRPEYSGRRALRRDCGIVTKMASRPKDPSRW